MSREALLATIAADPDADLPRLVFADFLDDHGEADRAEFIRLQCQTARTDPTDPLWLPAKLREYELFDRHRAEWMPGPEDGRYDRMLAHTWRRGFPDWVPANTPAVGFNGRYHLHDDDGGDRLAPDAPAPVLAASVAGFGPWLEPTLTDPRWRTTRELALMEWYAGVRTDTVDRFCRFLTEAPDHWPDLRRLDLGGTPSDEGLRDLSRLPELTAIRVQLTDIHNIGPSPAAVGALAAAIAGRVVGLSVSYLSPDQARALFRVPWPRLRRLELAQTPGVVATELARANLPALTRLRFGLRVNWLGAREQGVERSAVTLARLLPDRLATLKLVGWPADTLPAFYRAMRCRRLRQLWLWGDLEGGPVRLTDFVRTPACAGLQTLRLGRADGLDALADPMVLPELHSVVACGPHTPPPRQPLRWQGGSRSVVVGDTTTIEQPTRIDWTAG